MGTSLNEAGFFVPETATTTTTVRMRCVGRSVNPEFVDASQSCDTRALLCPHCLLPLHPIVLAPQQPDYALIASRACGRHCLFYKLRHVCDGQCQNWETATQVHVLLLLLLLRWPVCNRGSATELILVQHTQGALCLVAINRAPVPAERPARVVQRD
eukprot:COSAG02_NODE_158_length_32954_cov_16.416771_11_plen_157_part_00